MKELEKQVQALTEQVRQLQTTLEEQRVLEQVAKAQIKYLQEEQQKLLLKNALLKQEPQSTPVHIEDQEFLNRPYGYWMALETWLDATANNKAAIFSYLMSMQRWYLIQEDIVSAEFHDAVETIQHIIELA